MLTDTEAINLLSACKPLAERLTALPPSITPTKLELSRQDLKVLEGFVKVQSDPIVAGPGLLGKLFKAAELSQVEVSRLEQTVRLVSRLKNHQ
ncbi:MAG TPA: hypothetical protein VH186_07055 [Chloroflexia bacterium]|nr:hypothetical protein [Chloroflexia bacterium]